MEQDKFQFFCNCFENTFKKTLAEMFDIQLENCKHDHKDSWKKLSAVVGVVGRDKGRIHVTMTEDLIQKLYEYANDEPISDETDLCFYLAELTNMISGSGITVLNNNYKGSNLRLTPPAIFADEKIDIVTPQVQSSSRMYSSNYGPIQVEIGFEGV